MQRRLRQLFYGGDLGIVMTQVDIFLAYLWAAVLVTTRAAQTAPVDRSPLQPAVML